MHKKDAYHIKTEGFTHPVPACPWRTTILEFAIVPALQGRLSKDWMMSSVRNAWTSLYVAAVFRYQQVTMQQKMKAIDAAGRAKVYI